MFWEDVLLEVGVEVRATAPDVVELHAAAVDLRVRIERWTRSRHPSEVSQRLIRWSQASMPVLVVSDHLSPTVQAQLERNDVSYVTRTVVFLALPSPADPVRHVVGADRDAPLQQASLPRLPWRGRSAYQVLRRVIQDGLRSPQRRMARDAHVSQPRVSQVLQTLDGLGLIDRERGCAVELPGLLDAWMLGYPGPGGVTTRWFSGQPIRPMVAGVLRHFATLDVSAFVSGSIAADHLAPYALPRRATLYVDRHADLSILGLVRTPDAATAELSVTVADDPTVRPAAHDLGVPLEIDDVTGVLADPLQVLWDTAGEDDIDADQAVDALHRRLIERYRERHA